MSDRCFLDTNVLIYAHDISAGTKHRRALQLIEELWVAGNGVLSTQVLQEFAFTVRRKPRRPLSLDDTLRVVRQYLHWHIVINGPTSVINAMELELRYQIAFWDALILESAKTSGAEVLYSEDLNHGQMYGVVRVINPFH